MASALILSSFARNFIAKAYVGSIAATAESPMLATIYLITLDPTTICFKSRTSSDHSKAIERDGRIAFATYDHASNYDEKTGIQARGSAQKITDEEQMKLAIELYGQRFGASAARKLSLPELLKPDVDSTFYQCRLTHFKIVSHELGIHMAEYIPL